MTSSSERISHMDNDGRKELIRRAQAILSRPESLLACTAGRWRHANIEDILISRYSRESDDLQPQLIVCSGSSRVATVWSNYSEWPNPELEERALTLLRNHMVLEDLAGV